MSNENDDLKEKKLAYGVPIESRSNSIHQVANECLEPWRYICNSPGKNIRSFLIEAFQVWLQIEQQYVSKIKIIVGYLHNSSLLIDDIEDGSKLRRGKPVAHMVFGIPQTLNCANYVYFLAMEKCMQLNTPDALNIFTRELLNLHRGQGLELYWREHVICPTEEQYISMVMDKTGGLFRLALGLMQCFSKSNLVLEPLCNMISVYFQVRDDLINLVSKDYQVNKSFCEDLTEGKFSFPLIHAIRNSKPDDTRVISILRQKTENVELKSSVVELLRTETKSFEYTCSFLVSKLKEIKEEIDRNGGCPPLLKTLEKLHEEVLQYDENS